MESVRKKSSIATKMILAVVFITIFVGFVTSFYIFSRDYKKQTKAIEKKIDEIAKRIVPHLAKALWVEDEEAAGKYLNTILDIEGIVEVNVLIEDEKEFAFSRIERGIKDLSLKKRRALGELDIRKIIYVDEDGEIDIIGDLYLQTSRSVINERLKRQIYNTFIIQIFQVIALVIFIIFIFRQLVSRHLQKMASYAENIDLSGKDLSLDRKRSSSDDELQDLTGALNLMKRNLNEFKKQLENYAKDLEVKVDEATEELRLSFNKTEGMLSNINKAIFSVDNTGFVLAPVSKYSNTLFKKEIVGENGLKLLFFHLKDGSDEKKKLVNSFKNLFGAEERGFLNFKASLPNKVTIPDKEKEKGRVLDIQYVPLYNNESKVETLMFIVEDITEKEQVYRQNKEDSLNHKSFMKVLPFKDKLQLGLDLSELIEVSIKYLEKMVSFDADSFKIEDLEKIIEDIHSRFKAGVCSQLEEPMKIILKAEGSFKFFKQGMSKNLIWSADYISSFLLCLMRYAEALKTLHENDIGPGIRYSLPDNFEDSIGEKKKDLGRVMVNLLEYVFLVRNVEDLDEEKISNAPRKARLYAQFDDIISRVMYRSRLISFLLKVLGKSEQSETYMEFAELLKQMPSKDKLTEAALVNHLIAPYKKLK